MKIQSQMLIQGVPPVEEADEQELVNLAHGEEPTTHKQAMASPDANE